ncbi:hypothetical protein Bbelb_020010 [Branchiostoma belcheri]|nr:hypothetical protein Bbelb_020010 [Branchiostoma belcheri]
MKVLIDRVCETACLHLIEDAPSSPSIVITTPQSSNRGKSLFLSLLEAAVVKPYITQDDCTTTHSWASLLDYRWLGPHSRCPYWLDKNIPVQAERYRDIISARRQKYGSPSSGTQSRLDFSDVEVAIPSGQMHNGISLLEKRAIFDKARSAEEEEAFSYAIKRINADKRILPQARLIPRMEEVENGTAFF